MCSPAPRDAVHPGYLTQRLRLLVNRTGLPPIRLHDSWHGSAALQLTSWRRWRSRGVMPGRG